MQGLQKPHTKIWCWIDKFWKQKKGLQGTSRFYYKKWYGGTYRLGVFRKGTVLDDDLHTKRCSQYSFEWADVVNFSVVIYGSKL
jgi:hypothetical protein